MKTLAIIVLMITSASVADSKLEVVEIFRAETPEELEAALADGYPPPWLAEILEDETIPEEDRYWLDCRVRAVIAQDLHLFFDRHGDPIEVEAEWIAPGEDYWREHVMVCPVSSQEGEDEGTNVHERSHGTLNLIRTDDFPDGDDTESYGSEGPTLMSDPPGDILNLYGEKVGELAVVNRLVRLSRDASIGAVQSGGNEHTRNWDRTPYACILYPDGSFVEHPFEQTGLYRAAVSADGSTVVFICIHMTYPENEGQVVDAWVFGKEGELLQRITPPEQFYGTYLPQISPDGEYCCYSTLSMNAIILDCFNGRVHKVVHPSSPGRGLQVFSFSADGDYLCLGGHSAGLIVDLLRSDIKWQGPPPIDQNDFSIVQCSREALYIGLSMKRGVYPNYRYHDSLHLIQAATSYPLEISMVPSQVIISPRGSFILLKEKDLHRPAEVCTPVDIRVIREGE